MGRKTELRKNSMRPYAILPELWYLLSYDERKKHYQRWSTHRQPAIAAAEIARKRNGMDIVRNDDDLDRGAEPFKAGGIMLNSFINADNMLIEPRGDLATDTADNGYEAPDFDTYVSDSDFEQALNMKCLVCRKNVWNNALKAHNISTKPCCT